jgi:type IV pilus assembly protein PilE
MTPAIGGRGPGFSLIELFVALAVLAIVVALALPNYRQYVRRTHRTEAVSALLRIAAAQERFYLHNGRYAGSDELAPAPPVGLGIGATTHDYYALEVTPHPDLTLGYEARATVRPEAVQRDDTNCWVFSIDERGVRTATTRAGASSDAIADRCWR